jgi:hypothetical protein
LFRQVYLLVHNLTGLQLLKARSPNDPLTTSNNDNNDNDINGGSGDTPWSQYVTQPMHLRAKIQQRVAAVTNGSDISAADEIAQAADMTAAGRNTWNYGSRFKNMRTMLGYWELYVREPQNSVITGGDEPLSSLSSSPSFITVVSFLLWVIVPHRTSSLRSDMIPTPIV